MKLMRRALLLTAILCFVVCIVLLLNFTAANPTRRRYSSRVPLLGAPATSQQIGADGDRVLAADLHIARNETAGQRQTFCKSPTDIPADNNRCVAYYAALGASFRRPDFLTDTLILESKNRSVMDEDDRDLLSQIGDYSLVAILLHRPLWIFTRVDTEVADKYVQLAEATGGGLVRYFSVPGWVDPVERTAKPGLLLSGSVAGITTLWELTARRRQPRTRRRSVSALLGWDTSPAPAVEPEETIAPRKAHSPDPLGNMRDALERVEEAIRKARRKLE